MHVFKPHVAQDSSARKLLVCTAQRLAQAPPDQAERVRATALVKAESLSLEESEGLNLRIALSVLCDLRAHDWEIVIEGEDVHVSTPSRAELDPSGHKDHVREGLLVERDAQLREPATRRFISRMERQRRHGSRFTSILSLIRDGPPLAAALSAVAELPPGPKRIGALRSVIDPYVQLVEPGVPCSQTGLDLQDIWRYFRHTWVTPYRSVPGRQISFLIRDRAAENHPIIGIGSLASSVVQQRRRDEWIGWHPAVFTDALKADSYRGWSGWVRERMNELFSGLYIDDFIEEGVLTGDDLQDPSDEPIRALKRISKSARAAHRLYRQEELHKRAGSAGDNVDWLAQAQTHLFRSKRADRLARLLQARLDLNRAGFTKASPERLGRALETVSGRRATRTILRLVKASHVGIDMMDISVCGAVAPYGPILGGKLVSLLLASPDVVRSYADRYGDAASVIASSMAGRAIRRPPRLVLLMTTSLYGVASSQYNRLKVPSESHSGEGNLEYINLEQRTVGFGSYHFSKTTIDAMEVLLARAAGGREVNSIFGEGVNPKLRKVRTALHAVGLPSDYLLRHGAPRIVYAVPLATNFRDVLLGRRRRPKYILPLSSAGTDDLVTHWLERWLSRRIEREGVLNRVAKHSVSYLARHGARVQIPTAEEEVLTPFLSGGNP
jgi:hypothetical protein